MALILDVMAALVDLEKNIDTSLWMNFKPSMVICPYLWRPIGVLHNHAGLTRILFLGRVLVVEGVVGLALRGRWGQFLQVF